MEGREWKEESGIERRIPLKSERESGKESAGEQGGKREQVRESGRERERKRTRFGPLSQKGPVFGKKPYILSKVYQKNSHVYLEGE